MSARVLRSAAAFGAVAVIVPEHGAPPASAALAKAASGALDLVPLVRVVNLARALDRLKEEGFWSCGLDESARRALGGSISARARCWCSVPRAAGCAGSCASAATTCAPADAGPTMPSLNVSTAAAVALYAVTKRRV